MTTARKASEVLAAAWARIEDPAHWCQGDNALDEKGEITSSDSSTAVRWCAYGALLAEAGPFKLVQFLRDAAEDLFDPALGFVGANDQLGHEATRRVYQEAIRNARMMEDL